MTDDTYFSPLSRLYKLSCKWDNLIYVNPIKAFIENINKTRFVQALKLSCQLSVVCRHSRFSETVTGCTTILKPNSHAMYKRILCFFILNVTENICKSIQQVFSDNNNSGASNPSLEHVLIWAVEVFTYDKVWPWIEYNFKFVEAFICCNKLPDIYRFCKEQSFG